MVVNLTPCWTSRFPWFPCSACLGHSEAAHAIAVITCKSYANEVIASALKARGFVGSIVILQNGVNVETPFLNAGFKEVHRCVLYVTSQTTGEHAVKFRPISSCGVGVIHGTEADRDDCVAALNQPGLEFQFHAESNIQRLIWKKAILNAVFNSICPLLDVDNGIFMRDAGAAALAQEIVEECLTLTHKLGILPELTLQEIMQQLMKISHGGNGVLISTLQDIRHGRQTEIESLNLAMVKIAAEFKPPLPLIETEMLGRMVLMKAQGK